MKKFYLYSISLIALVALIFFTGCATVLGGKKNQLVVNEGKPPAAEVYLDGQKIGETPINTKLNKYLLQEGSKIEISKAGYQTETIILERKINPWYTIADMLTGGIWLGVDLGTGNIYRPVNNKISYNLEKAE